MRLFIFGQEINDEHELELIVSDDLGLDITIKYNDDILGGIEDTKHNCTEFHHLYNKKETGDKFLKQLSSAFESDIHRTGSTIRIEDIEWIKVEKAIILHKKY